MTGAEGLLIPNLPSAPLKGHALVIHHRTLEVSVEKCKETHNPGVWPYIQRCVRDEGHNLDWAVRDDPAKPDTARLAAQDEHYDRLGNIWKGKAEA